MDLVESHSWQSWQTPVGAVFGRRSWREQVGQRTIANHVRCLFRAQRRSSAAVRAITGDAVTITTIWRTNLVRLRPPRSISGARMKITRRFTAAGHSPYAAIPFRQAISEIKNPDGSVVFSLDGFDVPEQFSQVAADILAQKYFRKAGVARRCKRIEETQVPSWLWRSVPDETALATLPEKERYGGEMERPSGLRRLAGTWTYWGWKGGYFTREEDAQAFFDELRYMLAHRWRRPIRRSGSIPDCIGLMASTAPAKVTFMSIRHRQGGLRSTSAYEHPQPHACFIQSVADDLVGDGGIMDLWVREARLFKYGSGTGSNFSSLRGANEKLSGGGKLVRADELPQDRRPRGRRHQVGRHDPPRCQDGRRRRRSSGYRGIHHLEGARGAEGRRPRDRLEDLPEAAAGRDEGLRQLRGAKAKPASTR